jgi:L-asparaginase
MRPAFLLLVCYEFLLVDSALAQATAPAESTALPVCQLIATGGTIAMKIDPVTRAPIPALTGEDLVASVPGLASVAAVRVENLFNIPSPHINPSRWLQLRESIARALDSDAVGGVVVTHGTDTMEETAYLVDLTVRSEKPVVFVGAQRNASEPDFDGPRNLLNAVRICVAPEARGKGTLIALNNEINAARETTKTHTSSVETFKSGEFGLLGVVDHDRVVFQRTPIRRQYIELAGRPLPRVDIVPMYAGADGTLLQAAVASGARGLVIQALGWGNVNEEMYQAIENAIKAGVPVVVSTRVPNGRVLPVYGFIGGGQTLKEAGVVFADNLSPQKARILLMLTLQKTTDARAIQEVFDR